MSLLSFFLWVNPANALDIPHEFYTLPNGLSVILIEDHSIPQVVVDTWYNVGSSDDPKGSSGFAHLFEHLMFMGTPRIPQGAFDNHIEENGGWNNASTHADYTNYYNVGPSETLPLLLFLEADRMLEIDITQEKLDLQRDVVRNERRQNYEDQPYGSIWLNLSEMMYPPGHPYHLEGIGSHEDLQAATLDTVTQFYQDWYMPNNATLCVAGDIDIAQTKSMIETYFGAIPVQQRTQAISAPIQEKPFLFEKIIYDHVHIPAITIAWHTPAYLKKGDAELDILANILAGANDSRFPQKWIQESTLVQEFEVFQLSNQHGSLFVVQAFVRPDVELSALARELKADIEAIGNGTQPILGEEIKRAVNDWKMHFYNNLESNLNTAEALQSLYFHTKETSNFSYLISRYQTVIPQDIEKTIQQHLSPQKAAVLYVLPKEKE